MTQISKEDILKDNNTTDPNSITCLSLTRKALTNVSCLSHFTNLERLDLAFNSLTSLKGLESCSNLKWLSVKENKLQNLNGIESLTNLTVFNAGKNKLKSMDGVKNLLKLRALILNDNEIASITGLDQLQELNTLVLSRNPIHKMGDSLSKLKSIAKISLSNCQLEAIDSSIKACAGLEELRLTHNDIKTIPAELGFNKKLQILDLGNNSISKWSDLEALSSLRNLKNLNLLGNPVAEKAKLLKKINKFTPGLQVFNSKRMGTSNKIEKDQMNYETLDRKGSVGKDGGVVKGTNNMVEEKSTRKAKVEEQKEKGSRKFERSQVGDMELDVAEDEGKTGKKKQKKKREKHVEEEVEVEEPEKRTDKKSKRKAEKAGIDVIDDKDTPFMELLAYDNIQDLKENGGKSNDGHSVKNIDSVSALVTYPTKKKKAKNQGAGASALQLLTPAAEFGLGGPSAWDDE